MKSSRFSKLRVENLEERTLLAVMAGGSETAVRAAMPTEAATWVVNTLEDPASWDTTDDVVSLREAIALAGEGDFIVFDSELAGGTISLNGDEFFDGCLEIYEGITIDASSIGGITIDACGHSQVFRVNGANSDIAVNLINLTIADGKADEDGGGIYNLFATLTLKNCIMTGNYASTGGGICNFSGTLTLINCTVSGNTAVGYLSSDAFGSGIYNVSGTLTMTNCLVYGNTGGTNATALYNQAGNLRLFNCTIANNKCRSIATDDNGTAELFNSIALNIADGTNYHAYNTLSDYMNWSTSENCLSFDSFKPLFTDPLNGDFSLAFDSQAADCGNNEFAITETDLDGNSRIMFGIVDLGAYESQRKRGEHESETPSTVVTTEKDIIDDTDGLISIREAIMYASDSDTVTFDESLSGKTILLAGTELSVNKSLTFDASDIGGITIDANDLSRVLCVNVQEENGTVELKSLKVRNGNSFLQNGGGIYIGSCSLTMTDCIVTENKASCGGGIYNSSATLTMVNCTVARNDASCGGGIYHNFGAATITSCAISENFADDAGGGIFVEANSAITVTNSVIFGNAATDCGGGIYKSFGGLAIITNSTIAGNSAYTGGGICTHYDALSVINTIVALNYSEYGDDIHGTPMFSGNNLIGIDPGFVVPPAFIEGRISNLDVLDLSLTAGSWAIDHGINVVADVETDIAGRPRICAAWKEFPTVDIGAYEYQEETEIKPAWIVTTANDVVDDYDGLISLREAICNAKDGDTIVFDASLSGETITLKNSLGGLSISQSIAIDATSIGGITINTTRGCPSVFNIFTELPGKPVDLIMLTITGGFETYYGGGINNNNSALSIINSTISKNFTEGRGGGIFNQNGTLSIVNSIISGNSANFGGGIYCEQSIITVLNSVISGNSADTRGGGIFYTSGVYNQGYWKFDIGLLTLINSTVSGNTSYFDGGIYSNTADVSCGFSPLTIANSIVAQNYSGLNDGTDTFDYYFLGGNNIIDSAPGFIAPPLFDEQGNLMNLDDLNLSLTAESQAIDAGENSHVVNKIDVAGNPRVVAGTVDIGAYEYQYPLDVPEILTGSPAVYVSAGASRHQLTWTSVENASGYELQYSADGSEWTTISTTEISVLITGLAYGMDVQYKIRATGNGIDFTDSDWSEIKTFAVCPMDINGDGDITGVDRTIMISSWLTEEGDDDYRYCADINGDGDVSGSDLVFLSNNWLCEVGVDDLVYPRPLAAADTVFAEFASAELDVDPDVF